MPSDIQTVGANGRTTRRRSGSPPTNELGAMTPVAVGPWSSFVYDELETVPELQFPLSVRTYHAMRNDGQVEGLHAGATMPIRRYKWMINPNGCPEDRVERLAGDIGLPIKGKNPDDPIRRTKKRFSFDGHLKDAMLASLYGFYDFEQVGKVESDGFWHLRKLAARPPMTIERINLAEDGGLLSVVQNINGPQNRPVGVGMAPEIPVDRLVHYAWEKEGANWFGRSMLRALYRNWLIKDRLLRVDAIKHERNGMGVPIATGAQGMTEDDLAKLGALAQTFKAGENAGGAIPYGTELDLIGTKGSIPDTIASINMHDEQMSRRYLMMFMQLGSTLHGSRALGKDFVDYFQLAQEMLANWFLDIFNSHVIEDYWDWNYGEEEEYTPLLMYQRNDDPRFAAADLAVLIQNGAIQVDDEIEQAVREAMDLPARKDGSERTFLPGHEPVDQPSSPGDQPGQPSTQPGNADPTYPDQNPTTAKRGRRGDRAAATSPVLPDSPPRRVIFDYETEGAI